MIRLRPVAAGARCWRRYSASVDESPLRVVLVMGSTREKRIGGRVAGYLAKQAEIQCGMDVTVVDPRSSFDGYFMRLMEKAYFHYKEGEAVPEPLEAAATVFRGADAFLVCTPEYNHTIAPALTNTMNHFGSSIFTDKPSGIATYSAGLWGGVRCGVALRAYLSELGCLPVSATMQLPSAWKTSTWDGDDLAEGSIGAKSAERMLGQLQKHGVAMRRMRMEESSQL